MRLSSSMRARLELLLVHHLKIIFMMDPPPDFESVLDYYSKVESNVTPSNIKNYQAI